MKVELLYIDDCPNSRKLAPRLARLLQRIGMEERIELRKVASDNEALRLRFLGSPTVRVNGRDIEAAAEQRRDFGVKCRLYRNGDELVGVPDDASILAALDRESHPNPGVPASVAFAMNEGVDANGGALPRTSPPDPNSCV